MSTFFFLSFDWFEFSCGLGLCGCGIGIGIGVGSDEVVSAVSIR